MTIPNPAWLGCFFARGRQTNPIPRAKQKNATLKLARKNVFQPEMQFGYECFQFIHREMLFQSLDTPERLVRKSDLLRKFDVGQLTPFFTHEDCQLLVEITSHRPKMANNPPRMCGDMKFLQKKILAQVKFRRRRGDEAQTSSPLSVSRAAFIVSCFKFQSLYFLTTSRLRPRANHLKISPDMPRIFYHRKTLVPGGRRLGGHPQGPFYV
jgi:hypothetical protein